MFNHKIDFKKNFLVRMACIIGLIIVVMPTVFNFYKSMFPSKEEVQVQQI